MDDPKVVYVSYIKSTREEVWHALIDGEQTKLFWGRHRNVSDWKPGSRWEHQHYDDSTKIDVVGEILESVPPAKLVLTWAEPHDCGNPDSTSRVTFDIESFGDAVRLTVRHDKLRPESDTLRSVERGWPVIVSSLKSLLETGMPLSITTRRWA